MNNFLKNFLIHFFLITSLTVNHSNAEFDVKAKTAILQDFQSGDILFEKESDMSIYPASMTKIMTTIIAFDMIKNGDLSLEDKFIVSENAWRLSTSGYSSMFIMVGDEVSVENLLKGIIIASGNDACVALSEGIAGSEEEFSFLMNSKASEIGMENTNFTNSSGINDPDNYSTVKDILIMSNYLIKNYPKLYDYYKEKEFTWDRTGGDPITQGNRNPLLYKRLGADGIKTGYLAVEKYSLASSIFKNNRRLIAVASGFQTKNDRSRESVKLLTHGLTKYDLIEIAKINKEITNLDVWLGKKNEIKTYIGKDIYKTLPKAHKKFLKVKVNYEGPIEAPIKKDEVVGKLQIYYKDTLLDEYDLLAFEDIKKVNIVSRLFRSINYLIWGDV
ncbi:MAG: D-alanyl-D-alanine carboxypeptidase [Candidatus Pelagibacter sp. TMED273]|nr:MAG: D-alanyl-D-alanine carboxypeptidase [Candidatus Pelagibacter sp. TMED273]|tara:strand:- start:1172 stop:2335 length:1164 start_codon:yes stop_codon:yes gene_type:complete